MFQSGFELETILELVHSYVAIRFASDAVDLIALITSMQRGTLS